jgi:uncharacterized membrane protein YheB (UPF0754 family)
VFDLNAWIMLAFNIAVGSVIGGVTNELAIRMLFRPYKPWMIGSFRVPFTPGLIPRRRDEIGVQMGKLVEHHLLTPEGIKKAIAHADGEPILRTWMTDRLDRWLESDQTLREQLQDLLPALLPEEGSWSDAVREPIRQRWKEWAFELIRTYGDKPLGSLISQEAKDRLDSLLHTLSRMMLERLSDYLQSQEGQQDVQNMIRGLLGGGGGMFGGLVGMFLGDDKIIGKIIPYLEDVLKSPQLADRISALLQLEADKLLEKRVTDVTEWIGKEQLEVWTERIFYAWEKKSLEWLDKTPGHWFGRFRQPVVEQLIPRFTGWAFNLLEQNVDRLFAKLSIADIVTRQVEGFPLERVEEMILGVTGKEFRMITILGFILGGLIGLVQGLINLIS